MKLYLFVILLLSSTYGKVIILDENVHASNITSKDDATANKITSFPTQSLSKKSQNNIQEPVYKTDDSINTAAADVNNAAFDTNNLIIAKVATKYPEIKTSAAILASESHDISNDKDSNVTNSDTGDDRLPTTTAKLSMDPNENDVDSIIIIHHEDTQLTEIPKPKVDNGKALLLTSFIKHGRIAEARNASRVDQNLFLGFESYSGFLTVDENMKSHLFFWYFPVPNKPVNETPWILWLRGGPGASSLFGLFEEIGPFTFSPSGNLEKNDYSWIHNHSLLFIDNPVGTGYSFTESREGYAKVLETYTTHLDLAMKQFIQIFPELQAAPLFIAGESYAGKYVPALAHRIHRHRQSPPHFNLKGVMLGNALVDPEDIRTVVDSFEYFGLIDQTQRKWINPLVERFQDDIDHNRSVLAKKSWEVLVNSLLTISHQKHAYNFLRADGPGEKYTTLLDKSDVKRALHVGDTRYYRINPEVYWKLDNDFLSSTKAMLEELLDHYRALMYCGQLDQMLPCQQASKNHHTMKWNGSSEFLVAERYPYIFNGSNAGYYKTGGHLTEVMFLGAGHMAPQDAPAPVQALIASFTHNQPLAPRNQEYEDKIHEIQTYLKGTQTVTRDNMLIYV